MGATDKFRAAFGDMDIRVPPASRRKTSLAAVLGKIVVSVECPVEHLAGDVLRHVSGPALGRVEGDHAESIAVLAGEKIADDGFAIGLGGVGLIVGDAELAVVVQDQVDGDVVGICRCRARHGTQPTDPNPTPP